MIIKVDQKNMLEKYKNDLINKEINLAFEYYRKHGFPYCFPKDYEKLRLFRELLDIDIPLSREQQNLFGYNNMLLTADPRGSALASSFHKHIFESHALGMRSPIDSYKSDKYLLRAIQKAFKYSKKINDANVFTMLKLVEGTQVCAQFRPLVAKAIYKKFQNGELVFDPSCGYGGRLLGFMLTNHSNNSTYIGVDPNTKTQRCNSEMANFYGYDKRTKFICSPMEDVDISQFKNKVDFIFTSPPYFKKEIYSTEITQSCNKYQEYHSWLNNFWYIVLDKMHEILKPKHYMAINIQNVKIQTKNYPLVGDTLNHAKSIGFDLDMTLHMQFVGFGKNLSSTKTEPIFIFRKSNK